MRALLVILLVLVPAAVVAQNFPNMGEMDMQLMMQQAQKTQECMGQIDQADLDAIEQRSKEVDAEIKSLCAAGKRDKAQKKAMAYGREMAKNPTVQEMQKCGEMMQGAMPQMQMPLMDQDVDYSSQHVCDE